MAPEGKPVEGRGEDGGNVSLNKSKNFDKELSAAELAQ